MTAEHSWLNPGVPGHSDPTSVCTTQRQLTDLEDGAEAATKSAVTETSGVVGTGFL